jgi:azurin
MKSAFLAMSALSCLLSVTLHAAPDEASPDKALENELPVKEVDKPVDDKPTIDKPANDKPAVQKEKDCVFKLTGNGFMQYGLDAGDKSLPFPDRIIKVPKKCLNEAITFSLRYDGDGKKVVMGHNLVISEEADVQKILDQSRAAKPEADYLEESTKKLIIGRTKMIGEKEADSFTIAAKTLKEGKDYAFFCSFPGHAGLMKGKLRFVDSAKS